MDAPQGVHEETFLDWSKGINRGKRTSRIWEKHDVYLPHLVSNIGVIHLDKLRWYKFKLFWQMECHTVGQSQQECKETSRIKWMSHVEKL